MAIKFNNSEIDVKTVEFKTFSHTADVERVVLNGDTVWCKPFQLTIQERGTTVTVIRTRSFEPTATLGQLHNGDTVYYDDLLTISVEANTGYVNPVFHVVGLTNGKVTNNVRIRSGAIRFKWNAVIKTKTSQDYTQSGYSIQNPDGVSANVCEVIVISEGTVINRQTLNVSQTLTLSDLDYDDEVYVKHHWHAISRRSAQPFIGLELYYEYRANPGEQDWGSLELDSYQVHDELKVTRPSTHLGTTTSTLSVMTVQDTSTHSEDDLSYFKAEEALSTQRTYTEYQYTFYNTPLAYAFEVMYDDRSHQTRTYQDRTNIIETGFSNAEDNNLAGLKLWYMKYLGLVETEQ